MLKPPDVQSSPIQFWTTYVKGSARACALLFLASQVIERQWDLTCLAPDLQRSLTAIFARRAVMTTDIQSVALANAKFSQQGGIRKAHCVLTWVGKLSLLQQNGLNAEEVLKTWNSQATNAGALGGNKRVAVLNALKMPSDCVQLLIRHLSEFGDKSAFYEDAFSNRSYQSVLSHEVEAGFGMTGWQCRKQGWPWCCSTCTSGTKRSYQAHMTKWKKMA